MRLVISKNYEDIEGYSVDENVIVFKNKSLEAITEYLKDEKYNYHEDFDMWYLHDTEEGTTYTAKIYNS